MRSRGTTRTWAAEHGGCGRRRLLPAGGGRPRRAGPSDPCGEGSSTRQRPRAESHLADTIGIELSDSFCTYLGWLVPWGMPITLLADRHEDITEAQQQLVRIGIDRPAGSAEGGLDHWAPDADRSSYAFTTFAGLDQLDNPTVLDVRQHGEFAAGHLAGSTHVPLHELPSGSTRCRPVGSTCTARVAIEPRSPRRSSTAPAARSSSSTTTSTTPPTPAARSSPEAAPHWWVAAAGLPTSSVTATRCDLWTVSSRPQTNADGAAACRRIDDSSALGDLHLADGDQPPSCAPSGFHQRLPSGRIDTPRRLARADRRTTGSIAQQRANGLLERCVDRTHLSPPAPFGAVAPLVPVGCPRCPPGHCSTARGARLRRRRHSGNLVGSMTACSPDQRLRIVSFAGRSRVRTGAGLGQCVSQDLRTPRGIVA